jgi:hypothetical protein
METSKKNGRHQQFAHLNQQKTQVLAFVFHAFPMFAGAGSRPLGFSREVVGRMAV